MTWEKRKLPKNSICFLGSRSSAPRKNEKPNKGFGSHYSVSVHQREVAGMTKTSPRCEEGGREGSPEMIASFSHFLERSDICLIWKLAP